MLVQTLQGQAGSGPAEYLGSKLSLLKPALLFPTLHCASSAELGLSQGGPTELLLVKIQGHVLRSPCTASLEHQIPSPSRSPLSFLLLGGCTIQFISCFPDLLWALLFCL